MFRRAKLMNEIRNFVKEFINNNSQRLFKLIKDGIYEADCDIIANLLVNVIGLNNMDELRNLNITPQLNGGLHSTIVAHFNNRSTTMKFERSKTYPSKTDFLKTREKHFHILFFIILDSFKDDNRWGEFRCERLSTHLHPNEGTKNGFGDVRYVENVPNGEQITTIELKLFHKNTNYNTLTRRKIYTDLIDCKVHAIDQSCSYCIQSNTQHEKQYFAIVFYMNDSFIIQADLVYDDPLLSVAMLFF